MLFPLAKIVKWKTPYVINLFEKNDIVGKKKNKEIVEPRMICIYLICELLDLPLVAIGKKFGDRDHTTIMHARDKITEQIKTNNKIKVYITDIKDLLTK